MVYSINNYLGKEEQLKNAFKNVLKKMVYDKKNGKISENDSYGYGRFYGGKISVLSIRCQADDHLFDDHPEWFGISKNDGHLIREYFHNVSLEISIKDLYSEFYDFLDGEPMPFIKNNSNNFEEISKNAPLFDAFK